MADSDLEFLGVCVSDGVRHVYALNDRRRTLCGFSYHDDTDIVGDDEVCFNCFRALVWLVNASKTFVRLAKTLAVQYEDQPLEEE